MVEWKHKLILINPVRAYEKNELGLGQLADEVAIEIMNSPFFSDYSKELEGIVEELQDITDENNESLYDEVIESLYNWADGEEPDTIVKGIPRKTKTCWISME